MPCRLELFSLDSVNLSYLGTDLYECINVTIYIEEEVRHFQPMIIYVSILYADI